MISPENQGVNIKLEQFEGPLDLLLYLIQKNELDILNIPIVPITEQYLSYLELMDQMNLEVAGDYLVWAATLMRLKSRSLLPQEILEEGETEEIISLEQLSQHLIEYRQFKEVAQVLKDREDRQRNIFYHPGLTGSLALPALTEEVLVDANLYDLLEAFRRIMAQSPKISSHEMERLEINPDEQKILIFAKLGEKGKILFQELFDDSVTRPLVVVTFFAILDLTKGNQIIVKQNLLDGTIWIFSLEAFSPQDAEAFRVLKENFNYPVTESHKIAAKKYLDEFLKKENEKIASEIAAMELTEEEMKESEGLVWVSGHTP